MRYKLNLEDVYKKDDDSYELKYIDLHKIYATDEGKRYIDHLLLSLGIDGYGLRSIDSENIYNMGRLSVAQEIARALNYDFEKNSGEDKW